jgi:hypothetical protein
MKNKQVICFSSLKSDVRAVVSASRPERPDDRPENPATSPETGRRFRKNRFVWRETGRDSRVWNVRHVARMNVWC